MNTMKKLIVPMLYASIVMMALIMTAGPAAAAIGMADGEVAEPGSELHELGGKALNEGLGGLCYFTDGEGHVLKVHAEEIDDGNLRVSVEETNIPKGAIANNQEQTLEAERILKGLEEIAGQQPKVGNYAVLPNSAGAEAYEFGVMVEQELTEAE